jgi:hypothetical protein
MPPIDPPNEANSDSRDVFISFSSTNIETARCICDELESQGITCWLADRNRNDIPPGRNWADHLMHGLQNSRMVLLIFSKDSNLSKHVQNEIGIAFDRKLEILPVRIQDEIPDGVLQYYLVHTQWFDVIPAPPPLEKDKLQRLTETVQRLTKDVASTAASPNRTSTHQETRIPFFSTWVLRPIFPWAQRYYESTRPFDGALITYLFMLLVFFLPLVITHRIVGDYPPATLSELFSVASSSHYYYPDLNAILFDMVLHPAAFATLAYFTLFLNAKENQYLTNAVAGFISTKNVRVTKFWINLANLFVVKVIPVAMAVITFFYRRSVYIGYGMQEPLVFWASFAVAISIYAYVALSINASYIALLLEPIPDAKLRGEDDRQFSSAWARMLSALTVIFIYIILMILVEIADEWIMANFNYTPMTDLMRWIVLFYGGIAVLILVGRILWFVLPEVGTYSRTPARLENRVQAKNLLILIVPVVLIVLTVRLWLQTR